MSIIYMYKLKLLKTKDKTHNFFQISNDCKAVSCRAIWRVCAEDIQLAQYQIASKRLELDDLLCKINGVQYFFSSISCVASNARSSRAQRAGERGVALYLAHLSLVCAERSPQEPSFPTIVQLHLSQATSETQF